MGGYPKCLTEGVQWSRQENSWKGCIKRTNQTTIKLQHFLYENVTIMHWLGYHATYFYHSSND